VPLRRAWNTQPDRSTSSRITVRPTYRASAAPTTRKSHHHVRASKTAALASEASSWAAWHNAWVAPAASACWAALVSAGSSWGGGPPAPQMVSTMYSNKVSAISPAASFLRQHPGRSSISQPSRSSACRSRQFPETSWLRGPLGGQGPDAPQRRGRLSGRTPATSPKKRQGIRDQ
jgi:hypothetical protein